jgi:hypothetical protein
VAPLLSLECWGHILYGVYETLAVCHCWNRSYPEFWVVIRGLWYSEYFTSIVAPEPSIEQMVKNVLSTGGRIDAHMLIWALSWDSVTRLWC